MSALDPGQAHGQYAADYDRLAREYYCYAAEALFGLAFEYARPGESLLDVGIGTGLGSAPFAKAGLLIYGLDVSSAMLAVCRSKALAVDLRLADLAAEWPYPARRFNHVLACGVLHFVEPLDPVFESARRVLQPGGLFIFTTKAAPAGGLPVVSYKQDGLGVFLHQPEYVLALAASHAFARLKAMRFLVGADPFDAWVMRLEEPASRSPVP